MIQTRTRISYLVLFRRNTEWRGHESNKSTASVIVRSHKYFKCWTALNSLVNLQHDTIKYGTGTDFVFILPNINKIVISIFILELANSIIRICLGLLWIILINFLFVMF